MICAASSDCEADDSAAELGFATCIPNAGIANATSSPPDRQAASTGRRITRSISPAQNRDSPAVASCGRNGIRPRSTRGPSSWSSAGSTVTDPATAQPTTTIVPAAIPLKTSEPTTNWPAIAIATVVPAISTERPEVRDVRSSASRTVAPRSRSSRERTT